ncbi:hypothetical protein H4R18_005854 [Coemansia javaensis]|uniref:Fungal-type protein kinase domain-containing protein n=1 Tax=Coemansia javaensis TaxID=2761396 RepID=A0A9W8LEQ5_9FUNG|nr:hypothetical protein H4R18_005854 [Coemansia javaensis]
MTQRQLQEMRVKEAKDQASSRLFCCDQDGVLGLARPGDEAARKVADAVGSLAVRNLEHLVEGGAANGDLAASVDKEAAEIVRALRAANAAKADNAAAAPAQRAEPDASAFKEALRDEYAKFTALVAEEGPIRLERSVMYAWLKGLVLFVAHHVKHCLDDAGMGQLLLPCRQTDTRPAGSDDWTRFDVGLVVRPIARSVCVTESKADYREVAMIAEAKARRDGRAAAPELDDHLAAPELDHHLAAPKLDAATYNAFVQLFMYTRQVYASQIQRRYVWGLTLCGAEVRACIFTSCGALASRAMNLRTPEGRARFVRLVVDWSTCAEHQLGMDPTIKWVGDKDCWRIEVPRLLPGSGGSNSSGGTYETVPYYFEGTNVAAERLFGRHTRCFPASSEEPVSKDSRLEPDVVIKYAWSCVEKRPDGTMCDGEVAFLRRIGDKFRDTAMARHLPIIQNGGVVQIGSAADTTDAVLGALAGQLPVTSNGAPHVYVHTRIAMQPIAQRLRDVESVYELVIVIADAVRAHREVLAECDILHRDISENNIMFTRGEGNSVCGVLVDFDSAAVVVNDPAAAANEAQRCICTGTVPFMSVNNLEGSRAPRTAVDDMESVLYLLCWLGVWGVTVDHRKRTAKLKRKITKWSIDMEEAAYDKRLVMLNNDALGVILEQFCDADTLLPGEHSEDDGKAITDSYVFLADLVLELRGALFDNPDAPLGARGTMAKYGHSSADAKAEAAMSARRRMNPYEERAKAGVVGHIHEAFVAALDERAARAKNIIEGAQHRAGSSSAGASS